MGPTDMEWVYIYTFTWHDDFENTTDGYDPGDDGVFEFVVGNCVATETDMLFPPYMILPERVTMQLGFLDYDDPTFPGFYFKWKMTYAEPVDADVYDIPYDAWYGAFCGDAFNQIQPGIPHPLTEVFCTLDDPNDPDFPQCGINFTPELFEKMNYLFNNTRQNGDIDIMYALTPLEGENMQKAIWGVLHSSDGLNPYGWSSAPLMSDPYYPAYNMASMALQHGEDFVILPGGWAGIGFVSPNLVQGFDFAQLILILVDP
jgi:hypothetical protein